MLKLQKKINLKLLSAIFSQSQKHSKVSLNTLCLVSSNLFFLCMYSLPLGIISYRIIAWLRFMNTLIWKVCSCQWRKKNKKLLGWFQLCQIFLIKCSQILFYCNAGFSANFWRASCHIYLELNLLMVTRNSTFCDEHKKLIHEGEIYLIFHD